MYPHQQLYHFLTKYKLKLILFVGCLGWLSASFSYAADDHEKEEGNFIFHHIGDSHEWHLATAGQIPITIPLPIILASWDRGMEVFSSSRFWDEQHQRISYQDYHVNTHEKIVANDPTRHFYDLSITKNVASMLASMILLVVTVLVAAKRYRANPQRVPRGFWGMLEMFISFVRDEIALPNIGSHHYRSFMPYLLSVFFFIWLNNLMGLLPGAANVTGNITVTLVLALFTFIITIIHGDKHYWGHIFRPPGVPMWLLPIMIPVELLGMLTKPISLMIRLFANITAGHIILLSIISLIFIFQTSWASLMSVPFGAFMFLLKLIVAFLQAYIFTLLSAIYFGMAVGESDKSH